MKCDMFLSSSRKDVLTVDDVVSRLEQHGFHVWFDKNGIESGDAFKRVIVKAIEKSRMIDYIMLNTPSMQAELVEAF